MVGSDATTGWDADCDCCEDGEATRGPLDSGPDGLDATAVVAPAGMEPLREEEAKGNPEGTDKVLEDPNRLPRDTEEPEVMVGMVTRREELGTMGNTDEAPEPLATDEAAAFAVLGALSEETGATDWVVGGADTENDEDDGTIGCC